MEYMLTHSKQRVSNNVINTCTPSLATGNVKIISLTFVECKLSKKGKGSPYSITEPSERRVPKLIPVLGSQPAGDVNHKPDGWLPLLSARSAVTPATLKRAATNFAAW